MEEGFNWERKAPEKSLPGGVSTSHTQKVQKKKEDEDYPYGKLLLIHRLR